MDRPTDRAGDKTGISLAGHLTRTRASLKLMTTGPFYTTWALNTHKTVSARKASPAHWGTEDKAVPTKGWL